MFWGKTVYFHIASLHLGVQMGTGKLNAAGNQGYDAPFFHLGGSRNIPSRFTPLRSEVSKRRLDGPL